MLPDNRLDFIKNIEQSKIDCMTAMRKQFIFLDKDLQKLSGSDDAKKDGVLRCLSLARTNIETACMYTIKALCLMGEIKDSQTDINKLEIE